MSTNVAIKLAPLVVKAVCKCCGGPRSKFSAAWCKNCYSKKTRPANFDRQVVNYFNFAAYQEHIEREIRKDEVRIVLATKAERELALRARRIEEARARQEAILAGRAAMLAAYNARKAEQKAAIARRKAPSPAALNYPFISAALPDHADLLAVNSLIPKNIEGREDICQEIMIALWEKRITLNDLKNRPGGIRSFIAAFRQQNFESRGYAVSLDAPMSDGRSWHDVLSAETAGAGA